MTSNVWPARPDGHRAPIRAPVTPPFPSDCSTNYHSFRPVVSRSSSLSNYASDASSGSPVFPRLGGQSGGFLAVVSSSPVHHRQRNTSFSDIVSNFDHSVSLQARTALPLWVLDETGQVKLTMGEILDQDLLLTFVSDKFGCQFLVDNFPAEEERERRVIQDLVLKNQEVFERICADVFGNFFVQQVLEVANVYEQRLILQRLHNNMRRLCTDRYSCRVVQKVFETLNFEMKGVLMEELKAEDIVVIATDQHASHVIQKIMCISPLSYWRFIVEFVSRDTESLFAVGEDKYGCRVIQRSLEVLPTLNCPEAVPLLTELVNQLIANCHRLAINTFANYIIQHMLTADLMVVYRDRVIREGVLRNILSLAQEKFASHVVEKALECAPAPLLKDMMEEILYGYVPHPETRKDALDIILFHQYGNYVVQRMLTICAVTANARRSGIILPDMELRMKWLQTLRDRIMFYHQKLSRYSSGQRILEKLRQCHV